MKYYVIHIQTTAEGEAKSIFDFETKKAAMISFHSEAAADLQSDTVVKSFIGVMNETGAFEEITTI